MNSDPLRHALFRHDLLMSHNTGHYEGRNECNWHSETYTVIQTKLKCYSGSTTFSKVTGSVEGFTRFAESDMYLKPDPETYAFESDGTFGDFALVAGALALGLCRLILDYQTSPVIAPLPQFK